MSLKRFFEFSSALFIFVLFPFLLLYVGINQIAETRNSVAEYQTRNEMERLAEKLLQYSEPTYYYHSLLKEIFAISQNIDLLKTSGSDDSTAYLKASLENLNRIYAHSFSYVIWDSEGQVVECNGLSLMKTAFAILYGYLERVWKEVSSKYPGDLSEFRCKVGEVPYVKGIMGEFLIPDVMPRPLYKGNLGSLIIASEKEGREAVWWQKGSANSILVFVDRKILDSSLYLPKLLNSLLSAPNGYNFALVDLDESPEEYFKDYLDVRSELMTAYAKFENFGGDYFETPSVLALFKLYSSNRRLLIFKDKFEIFITPEEIKNLLLIAFALLFAIFIAIYFYLLRTSADYSVRARLIFCFVYANALPLLILGFAGHEYLYGRFAMFKKEAAEETAALISDLDASFDRVSKDYLEKLNNFADSFKKSKTLPDKDSYAALEAVLSHKVAPEIFVVCDYLGKKIYEGAGDFAFSEALGKNLLAFLNREPSSTYSADYLPRETCKTRRKLAFEVASSAPEAYMNDFMDCIGKFVVLRLLGEREYYCYFNALADENGEFRQLLFVFWDISKLQKYYLDNLLEVFSENKNGIKLIALSLEDASIFPKDADFYSLSELFRQTQALKAIFADKIVYKGEDYFVSSALGKNLSKIAVAGLFPLANSRRETALIILYLLLAIAASMLLVSAVARSLASSFLNPVRELSMAAKAISFGNFNYRLDLKSGIEFISLGASFNDAAVSLADLSLGTIIQESIFPSEKLTLGKCSVWGKSISMTRLGGDYFTYFSPDEKHIFVVLGDVAGHGLPAAMYVFMAETVLLLSRKKLMDPAEILDRIDKTLRTSASRRIKRMMTCIAFSIDVETGDCLVCNGGQAFPIKVSAAGKADYMELPGLALGLIKPKTPRSSASFKLCDGDRLVFYTDGFIEANLTEAIEPIGYNGFLEVVKNSDAQDPEEFYWNILEAYADIRADDDLTAVVLQYNEKAVGDV